MAEMYQNAHTYSSSSINPPPETDDISLFLRQILLRSSTTTATASPSSPANKAKQTRRFPPPEFQHPPTEPAGLSISDRIHGAGALFPASNANVSSSSVGTVDNDFDDCDCESEEGFENLMEEMAARPNPPRNPSKRSRAAEVHNLSEKRRRSRINEKMKALQKLIPNSNKTDKASMLDEAIEYLKQLQLQVQMLTMRNGLNLYSMSVPGVLPPNLLPNMTLGLNEGHGCLNTNITSTLPMHKEVLSNPMFSSLPIQCTNPGQTSVSNLPRMINPESSSQFESSFQTRHGQFQFLKPTDEFRREEMLYRPQMDLDHTGTSSLDVKASMLGRPIGGGETK